jgi:hypothetical protein
MKDKPMLDKLMHARTYVLGSILLASALSIGCGPSNPHATSTTGSGGIGGTGGTGGNAGDGGNGGTGGMAAWTLPACDAISGTSAVTFTSDEGITLAPTPGLLDGIGYTFGLAALDTPNVLLAEHKGILLRSDDAGCTWKEMGTLNGGPFKLNAAKGGIAYAWVDNGSAFYRIDDLGIHEVSTPAANIVGIGVDPLDGKHLRIGDSSGAMSDSNDGGDSWQKHGAIVATGIGYRFAFDPADIDHVLFGQSGDGAVVSFDGGSSFTSSVGLGQKKNAFSLVVSPIDKNIVWAEGIDLDTSVRHVYRSSDGGSSFADVIMQSAAVTLINGTLLVPHAKNPNVLYFVFGSYFNDYGTDLYRYDHVIGQVTKTHNAYDEVSAIVASPADPNLLYLGLTVENGI